MFNIEWLQNENAPNSSTPEKKWTVCVCVLNGKECAFLLLPLMHIAWLREYVRKTQKHIQK